jgi:hypothetical protein
MNVSGLARFGNRATTESLQIRTPGRPTLAISMRMDVRFPFTHQIVGTLSSNSRRVADFVLNRRLYSTAANPVAPLITVPRSVLDPATDNGRYTAFFKALLPAEQGLRNTEYPQGDGWAVFTVRSSGAVSMVGELGDGQVFSYTNYLSLDRVLPFYVALPGGRGSASGRITFRDVPGQSDADAVGLRWFKRANSADGSYPRGWRDPGGLSRIKVSCPGAHPKDGFWGGASGCAVGQRRALADRRWSARRARQSPRCGPGRGHRPGRAGGWQPRARGPFGAG